MRRRRKGKKTLFSPNCLIFVSKSHWYHIRSPSRLWNDLLIPGICVCALVIDSQREAVILLSAGSPRKPFQARPHSETALQLHPMTKPQRVRKKEKQRRDIKGITGVWQTGNYQKKGVRGLWEPQHHQPRFHPVDTKICWMFRSNDGKLDPGDREVSAEWMKGVLSTVPCMKPY